LAKIAVALAEAVARRQKRGEAGGMALHVLARGDGWAVSDVVCTAGPQDRPFGEEHARVCIAVVAAGSFQYRSVAGRELMTPGSLLLGNPGQSFECAHDHGTGDRCLSFAYAPEYFARLASDAGLPGDRFAFRPLRVPPLRETSALIARACAGLEGASAVPWEELALRLAVQALHLSADISGVGPAAPPNAEARVARIVREIEERIAQAPGGLAGTDGLTIAELAAEAGLNPYHFLRTFERVAGVTPHQYILRLRLREAALRLTTESARIIDIAYDCGFGDLSHFNRTFRAEFGVSPRQYRRVSCHWEFD
jgi:AraC-like DNA-binding protein